MMQSGSHCRVELPIARIPRQLYRLCITGAEVAAELLGFDPKLVMQEQRAALEAARAEQKRATSNELTDLRSQTTTPTTAPGASQAA